MLLRIRKATDCYLKAVASCVCVRIRVCAYVHVCVCRRICESDECDSCDRIRWYVLNPAGTEEAVGDVGSAQPFLPEVFY